MRWLLLATVLMLTIPGLAGRGVETLAVEGEPDGGPGVALSQEVSPSQGPTGPPAPVPLPPEDLSRFDRATTVEGLAVVVERSRSRLVTGRQTKYMIAVGNRGGRTERVTIRAAVPPWLASVAPLDGGEVGDGFIDWPVTIPPGGVTELRLTGAYASAGIDTPRLVAFTACALDVDSGQPIVCATDTGTLRSSRAVLWWGLAGVTGVAAVGLTAAALRRRRGLPAWPWTWPWSGAGSGSAG